MLCNYRIHYKAQLWQRKCSKFVYWKRENKRQSIFGHSSHHPRTGTPFWITTRLHSKKSSTMSRYTRTPCTINYSHPTREDRIEIIPIAKHRIPSSIHKPQQVNTVHSGKSACYRAIKWSSSTSGNLITKDRRQGKWWWGNIGERRHQAPKEGLCTTEST